MAEIEDLSEWAEDSFASACSKGGVTRNKSHQDRTGWDYLIEFRPTLDASVPADLRPIESSARVQIKSKVSGKPAVALKLSNALRFAKDPLPCFVVLYLATRGGEPVQIYARHFWQQEIEHALRRAREAHAEGREDLHKLSVAVPFSGSDDHTDDLIPWMRKTVGKHGDHYTDSKTKLFRSIGFEDGSIHGNIEFNPDDLQGLIDHQIGITPTAPPVRITLKQRRFGIDARKPLFEGTPDVSHLQSHPKPCKVRVRGIVGDDEWFDGLLYLPALPNLPVELFKVRVVADFIEVVIGQTSGGEFTFHLDHAEPKSLPALRKLVNVLRAAAEGPLKLQIRMDDSPPLNFSVTMPGEPSVDEFQQLANVITCFEKTATAVVTPDLAISIEQIYAAWNSIVEFNGLVTGTNMKGQFTLDRKPDGEVGPAAALYLYDYVDVGSWTFLALVRRPITHFEITGTRGIVECGDPKVIEAIIANGSGEDYVPRLQELYAESVRAEGYGVLQLFGGDYRQMRANSHGGEVLLGA